MGVFYPIIFLSGPLILPYFLWRVDLVIPGYSVQCNTEVNGVQAGAIGFFSPV